MGLQTAQPADPQASPTRGSVWKWWVCGLLLLATMINYMDRLTINSTAKRILAELHLTKADYGRLEFAFGLAFALGSLGTGWLVDRWNVRWMYPAVVLGWSVAGFATGFSGDFGQLALCRFILGLFEGGNWTCALRTTQRILAAEERATGNSILQSGAALGAIFTPMIVIALVSGPDTWRYPFFVIGAAGCSWVIVWLLSVRSEDLALPHRLAAPAETSTTPSLWSVYLQPRFIVLVIIVVAINLTWHFFRAWLPLYLQEEDRGYSDVQANWFMSAYYGSSDLGSLCSGFATLWLIRHGTSVHRTRVTVFAICALITTLSVVIARIPTGPVLLVLLLLLAFGALGLFPQYYSFSQELTTRHQGKLTGTLGCCTWLATALMQLTVGHWIEKTEDYATAVTIAGLFPLLGVVALFIFWREQWKKGSGSIEACHSRRPRIDGHRYPRN